MRRRASIVVPLVCWSVVAFAGELTGKRASTVPEDWRTFRNETFGYEMSYPPSMELRVFVDGSSSDLRDARTGKIVVQFDVWPSDECPRQPPGVVARDLGIQRAKEVTQADGDGSSSWCGDPVTVRASKSNDTTVFELRLTCESERTEETDDGTPVGPPIRTAEGRKGPTFFVDVSPPWQSRILAADPSSVDPRMRPVKQKADIPLVRRILATVRRTPTTQPNVVCIEELGVRGFTSGWPAAVAPVN